MTISVARRIQSHLNTHRVRIRAKTEPKPIVLYCKRNRTSKREKAHCEAKGFYPTEIVRGKRLNWTNGNASLECSLPRKTTIRWIWIELRAEKRGAHVKLLFDQKLIMDKKIRGFRCFCFRLPNNIASSHFSINIESPTFRPGDVIEKSRDSRELGVLVGEIRLAKYWWRNIALVPTLSGATQTKRWVRLYDNPRISKVLRFFKEWVAKRLRDLREPRKTP